MSVYQLQPVNPALSSSVIHVVPTLRGSVIAQIVEKLFRLSDILIQQLEFHAAGLASDGDSSFNILHSEFEGEWSTKISLRARVSIV
jgi:hypothetical protein